ncbi:lipid-A-disaccharide synthase [Helicobacter sp. MIT 14-3879]|uniref:lipid-A-disaccharide synthase n=1 Tax=Helicobacter sp. MIT 14-3879 TaxID=2040649 RepID=UPI000E1EA1DA|nr:lipid-A-disaccharide synthase [Helicobacter sp. MIT 14-3879]RDU64802.1 lipid-A-disaccharide synthase [Helicobacter sp. MIT 14-3879]
MNLFVSALEHSANIHLKLLLNELNRIENITLSGIFSSDISPQKPLYDINKFAVMGFIDAIKNISFFIKANEAMARLAIKADKVLLMDSSSFNIPLAKKIKKYNPNIEIIYYILPQVWAWKPWRAKIIEQYCDKLAAILPFELEYYDKKARFVGHPLLDEITEFRDSSSYNLITFMPGSRKGEINRIFPIFIEVKNLLKKQDSSLKFELVVPKHFKDTSIYLDISDFNISYDAQKSLSKSKFAFICSGTATLECAIIGTPFVLGYKAKWLDAFIVKRFLNIKYVGLANILYQKKFPNEEFHIELLQEDLNVTNLLSAYKNADSTSFLTKSIQLREYLKNGSAKEVATWLVK